MTVASLREIATKCEFINSEEMMKDRIILGMRDLSLQKKLLIRRGVSFKDVVEEVRATESSDYSATDFRKTNGVHHTYREPNWSTEIPECNEKWDNTIHCIYMDR